MLHIIAINCVTALNCVTNSLSSIFANWVCWSMHILLDICWPI